MGFLNKITLCFVSTFAVAGVVVAEAPIEPFLMSDEQENTYEELSKINPARAAKKIIYLNDQNGDYKLSKEEVDLHFRLFRFDEVDQNNNELLEYSELKRSYQASNS